MDVGLDERADDLGAELEAGDAALELSMVTVGVEDVVAEEVMEDGVGSMALHVDVEVGLDDVLHSSGVGGDDTYEGGDYATWAGADQVGDPVHEAGARVGSGGAFWSLLVVEKKEEHGEENSDAGDFKLYCC